MAYNSVSETHSFEPERFDSFAFDSLSRGYWADLSGLYPRAQCRSLAACINQQAYWKINKIMLL